MKTPDARTTTKSRPASPSCLTQPAGSRELFLVGCLFFALVGLLLLLSPRDTFVGRYFWLDEIHTYLLVTDPSLSHMLGAILQSVDNNLPLLHLFLWFLHFLGLPLNETSLRAVSLATCCVGLLGVYGTLRFSFSCLTAFAATITPLSAVLFVQNISQIRYYVFWFAISAWFCYCLAAVRSRSTIGRRIALAIVTFCLLAIHYFGIFTFLLGAGADFLTDSTPSWRERFLHRWLLLGVLPAVPLIIYFYIHQRAAYSVPTWIAPLSWSDTVALLRDPLMATHLGILLAMLCVATVGKRLGLPLLVGTSSRSWRQSAALLSLLLLPVVLIFFSLLIQPASLTRYALPAIAGVSALFALIYSHLHRAIVAAMTLLFLIGAGMVFRNAAGEMALEDMLVDGVADVLRQAPPDSIILFERRHQLYPLSLYYRKEFDGRLYLLDFEAADDPPDTLIPSPEFNLHERDSHRALCRNYPLCGVLSKRQLPRGKMIVFVAANQDMARLQRRFPQAEIRHATANIYQIALPGP